MLTIQKKKFAEALHTGKNQHEAAIDAGYSEKTARSKGSQLARDHDVIKYRQMLIGGINFSHLKDAKDTVSDKDLNDPIKVMTLIMINHIITDPKLALEAAAKLAPYVHRKRNELGRKSEGSQSFCCITYTNNKALRK